MRHCSVSSCGLNLYTRPQNLSDTGRTMKHVFALNRYSSPKFVFGKTVFEKKKFTSDVYKGKDILEGGCWFTSGKFKDDQLVTRVPLDVTHVPGVACLICAFFQRKRVLVYTYIKTLHPEAAQVVFKDVNSKWASSTETHVMEQAECDGALESVMHEYQKSKSMLCIREVCLVDYLPN